MYNNLQNINASYEIHQLVIGLSQDQNCDIQVIANLLNQINFAFWRSYYPLYEFSYPIQAFIQCIEAIHPNCPCDEIEWNEENTSMFLYELEQHIPKILASQQTQIKHEAQNQHSLRQYLESLTSHYARLLIVRVDLFIHEKYKPLVTIEDFNAYMHQLQALMPNKKSCFKNLQGTAWAIEMGKKRGFHCHLWLAYNGERHISDYTLGEAVGEKWVQITQGKGFGYNCNKRKRKLKYKKRGTLGIGMIHRNNPKEVANAIRVGLYLTDPLKPQHPCMKIQGMRTFGHGQYNVTWRRGIYK